MATTKKDMRDLWVAWTRDAMSKYSLPEEKMDSDELADDMADVSTKFADAMCDEFEERFEGGPRRKRKKREEPEDVEEEDDDLAEDDE